MAGFSRQIVVNHTGPQQNVECCVAANRSTAYSESTNMRTSHEQVVFLLHPFIHVHTRVSAVSSKRHSSDSEQESYDPTIILKIVLFMLHYTQNLPHN